MKTLTELAKGILLAGNDVAKWNELKNEAKKLLQIEPEKYPYVIHYCYGGKYRGECQYKEIIIATSEENAKYLYFTEQGHYYETIYSITQI